MRLITVLLPVLLSFSLGLHAQDAKPTQAPPKHSALDAPLFYEILLGELNARDQEPAEAFSLLLDAAQKTKDAAVFRRAVQIALQARSGESALLAAKAWSRAIPASTEANHFVLQILLGLNRTADTLEPIKHELATVSDAQRRDFIWSLPQAFERASDRKLASSTVQKALTNWLNNPAVGATAWASIGRLWLAADDKTKALDAATKGMVVDAHSEHPALLALSMMNPDTPQAEILVQKHLPFARPEFRMAYIKSLLNAQRTDAASQQLQIIRTETPDYADAWLINGALALQAGQYDLADKELQHYLELVDAIPAAQRHAETRRGRTQAFLSLSQAAQRRNDLISAEAWLQRVDTPEDVLRAQTLRASLMARQGRVDDAITLVQSLPENSAADGALKRAAEVQLLRDAKLYPRARDRLQTLTVQYPDDLDLVYELAMVHEKLGDLVEMERLLRSLMAAKPEDPHAYNALGYSLADRNMRLPEAIELIKKALTLSPKDPYIVDSLAWAEFRSGNKEEAMRLLQGAFKERPDPEIAAHLGEVLWAMDRPLEAKQTFREGLKLNPDNETLKATIQRLRISL